MFKILKENKQQMTEESPKSNIFSAPPGTQAEVSPEEEEFAAERGDGSSKRAMERIQETC